MLSAQEREEMEHALGRPKRVDGELDWRNYFCVGYTTDDTRDEGLWSSLAERGLAQRWVQDTTIYYRVTDAGKEALDG